MLRSAFLSFGAALFVGCLAALPAQELPGTPAVVERLCGDCHWGEAPEGGFDVDRMFDDAHRGDAAVQSQLEVVVQRLRSRTMPPPDEAQPAEGERRMLIDAFVRRALSEPGERVATLRRLTRRQYVNTVDDLFGVRWARAQDVLPRDAAAYGFDGQGDVQNMSPLLFEKYHDAASAVATLVLEDGDARLRVFAEDGQLDDAKLGRFVARALRKPRNAVRATVLELKADAAALRRSDSDRSVDGISETQIEHALLRSVLASPSFLMRPEFGRVEVPAELSAHELAVRLSYMLASSMPDTELRGCADDGSLLREEVLAAQALRLVRQREGRRFAEDFAVQWLGLRDVVAANLDFRRYPQIWKKKLRPSFVEEAVRMFAGIVSEDRSVLELLDADYTFANALLAKHYGLPKFKGGFRRVPLPDRQRGGLLGMSVVLMATSYPLRTSPVKRGQWILERLLDAPAPPPPPDAGSLPADDKQPDGLTLRERLEKHRSRASCAACHAQMDALGFALENYDAIGLWRSSVHDAPVDSAATLPDGTVIDGPVALKDELLRRRDEFVRAFAKNMLVYGIGRRMTLVDEPEILRIVAAVRSEEGGYRFSSLLKAVVTSPLFVMRDPGGRR